MRVNPMKINKMLVLEIVCVFIMSAYAWAGTLGPQRAPSSAQPANSENVDAQKKPKSQLKRNPQTLPAQTASPQTSPPQVQNEAAPSTEKVESKAAPAEPALAAPAVPDGSSEKKAEPATAGGQAPSTTGAPENAATEGADTPETETADEMQGRPAKETEAQPGALTFNFDDADLSEVIRTMADLLKINYLIDPKVAGKVTIHTAGQMNRKDLFPIFYQILEVNGLTAVKQGSLYKIIQAKDASRMPISSESGTENKKLPPEEEIIIQIIPLTSISADEMSKILAPFIAADGVIVTHAETNTLLVIDRAYNIEKILRLVNAFDADVFQRVKYRFFHIKYGDVASLADVLSKMMESYGASMKTNMAFIPIDGLNSLLVVSSNPKIFDEVDAFIKNYDSPSQSTEPTIFVYPVKNGQAQDIASLLNTVFTGKAEKKEAKTSKSRNPLDKKTKGSTTSKGSTMSKSGNTSQSDRRTGSSQTDRGSYSSQTDRGTYPTQTDNAFTPASTESQPTLSDTEVTVGKKSLHGEIGITADEHRNSLIIQASPADYQIIKSVLTQIDIMPRQVLIEVTIAEITLDKSTQLGVEWSYKKGTENLSTSLLSATMGSGGLKFAIGNPARWNAAISALASDNKVNILSSPTILASNSVPATIDISTEVPVATSQYQYSTVDNPVLSTTIEYRDTGVMLTVTPHINELGLVTMELDQEVSDQAGNVSVGGNDYPSFFKRSAQTTLTVQSGQTIVIGGLIKQNKTNSATGAPWFASIPVLNFIFGKTTDQDTKTELIFMLSPYVIIQPDDVDVITKNFKEKVSSLFPDLKNESPVTVLDEKKK